MVRSDAEARLQLEAVEPPSGIAIATYSRANPSNRWRRVLPACLTSPGVAHTETSHRNPEDFAKMCALGPLSATLGEIATDFVSGPLTEGSLQAAAVLLRRLATHPMDRSAKLGALAAALCQKDGAF